MRFGVQASQANIQWSDLLSLWQELDRSSNFDSLWTMDHFVTGGGTAMDAGGICFDGWATLAALAQATSRIRIGCLVSGNTYRHPVVLAKMATTVDHISGGRLEFGIGAAWHQFEHQAYGIPFYTVKERLDRLEEAVQVIKLLWTKPPVSFQGRYYQLDGAPYNPPNVQKPHPPIMVGGGGEKRTLRIAARYGDAMNVQGSPDTFRHKVEVLEAHCRHFGRDPKEIRRTLQIPFFLTEDEGLKQRVVQVAAGLRGVPPEEARRGVLLGNTEEIKAQVQEFAAAGCQEIILMQFPRLHRESLLRFSAEVIPAFR